MRSVRVILGRRHWVTLLALTTGLVVVAPEPSRAERIPVTHYTSSDGLGGEMVHRIVRDSR